MLKSSFLTRHAISNSALELFATAICAIIFTVFFNAKPISFTIFAAAIIFGLPLLFNKPLYVLVFLTLFLPMRDVHVASIIHLKRLLIWSLFSLTLYRHVVVAPKRSSRRFRRFTISAGCFSLALIASTIHAIVQLKTLSYITHGEMITLVFSNALIVLEQIMLVFIVYYFFNQFAHIKRLADALLIVSGILAVVAILQYVLRGDIPGGLIFFLRSKSGNYGRATSVFANPNGFAVFLAPMIVFTFSRLLWETMSAKKRFGFMFAFLLLDFAGLFVSFSRTGILQLMFGLFALLIQRQLMIGSAKISRKSVALGLALILFAVLFHQHYDTFMNLRLGNQPNKPQYWASYITRISGDAIRKHSMASSLRVFAAHPIVGIGYDLIGITRINNVIWVENQYIKILAEMGIIGGIPFFCMLYYVFATGLRFWHSPRRPPQELQIMMMGLLAGVAAYLGGLFLADFLHVMQIMGLLWVWIGMIFCLETLAENE